MTLSESIKKTLAYGQIFDRPQTPDEIALWLISKKKISHTEIKKQNFTPLTKSEISKREERIMFSFQKKKIAQNTISGLKIFPFVWFVGLTGSVASNNSRQNDDLDIFIITAPSTLWFIRPFVLLFLSLKGVRRSRNTPQNMTNNLICPNLWLDVTALTLEKNKQNIYTAHEVLQVVPLINKKHTHERFILQNTWVKKYLANAYQFTLRTVKGVGRVSPKPSVIASFGTPNRGNPFPYSYYIYYLFAPLNLLLFLFQYLIMLPYKKGESVSFRKAFFHNPDFQGKVLKKFSQISYNQ